MVRVYRPFLVHAPLRQANRTSWEFDQESCLAQYYLLHFPELTFFSVWGNGYNYGSGLTTPNNWWESGVPMNMA